MKTLHMVAFILLIIGGINWLLVGVFSWDIGELFGGNAGSAIPLSRIIYILVGLSALFELFTHKNNCSYCVSSPSTPSTPVNNSQM